MSSTKPIRRIAVIGTGVIGASWASLFLAKGLHVVATNIAPNAEAALRNYVEVAWSALERLGLSPGASQSSLEFTTDLAERLPASTSSRRAAPSGLTSKGASMGNSTSCFLPR
jgi:3-hydroxyacyl-CoA dehydrogenase